MSRDFEKAQRSYDAMLPEDYDDCENCEGTGFVLNDGAPDAKPIRCHVCRGEGIITREIRRQNIIEAKADAKIDLAD